MRKLFFFCFFVAFPLLLSGCLKTTEDIFQFENAEFGDYSAVADIVENLPLGDHYEDIIFSEEINPNGMGLVVVYGGFQDTMTEEEYEETVIYNGTFLFTLMDQIEWITFNFDGTAYDLVKAELEDWYERKLSEFSDEEELANFIQQKLEEHIDLEMDSY